MHALFALLYTVASSTVAIEDSARYSPCGSVIVAVSAEALPDYTINRKAPWSIKITGDQFRFPTIESKARDDNTFIFVAETDCGKAKGSWKVDYEIKAFTCEKTGVCKVETIHGHLTQRQVQ